MSFVSFTIFHLVYYGPLLLNLTSLYILNNTVSMTYLVCRSVIKSVKYYFSWLLSYFSSTVKGALAGLRQFLTTGSSLKMMKNTFYFSLKALFVLKIFKLLSWRFSHVEKQLNLKDKVNPFMPEYRKNWRKK